MTPSAPKSILKRPRAAVEPEVEEQPIAPGQPISDEPVNVTADAGDEEDDEDESDEGLQADEDEFSVGSDEDEEGSEDDEDAIRDMLEEGQERPVKSAFRVLLQATKY